MDDIVTVTFNTDTFKNRKYALHPASLWSCVRVRVCAWVQEWVVLGQTDLEKLIEKHLSSVQDWERNFKALKAKGKESERLPRYTSRIN